MIKWCPNCKGELKQSGGVKHCLNCGGKYYILETQDPKPKEEPKGLKGNCGANEVGAHCTRCDVESWCELSRGNLRELLKNK